MAKAPVKCLYCGEIFDRNKEPCQKIGLRYAHQECYDLNFTEEDDYREKIYQFVKKIFGPNYKYQAIETQRKSFVKKGMTNKGIYYTLKYYFEIQNGSIEKSAGRIGIVPYVYEEAQEYYEKIDKMARRLAKSVQQTMKERIVDVDLIETQQSQKSRKIDMNSLE